MSGSDQAHGGPSAEAADWHARLRADDASEADFHAFEGWIAAPHNRAAYDRIDLAWSAAASYEAAFADAQKTRAQRSWALPATMLAAAAALMLVVFGLSHPRQTIYESSPAAMRSIELADGSVITLNRRSRVAVVYGAGIRRVRLIGEAAFDVRHDPQRPFVIDAADQQIRVVGTEFNVLDDHGAVSVAVRRGVVQVGSASGEIGALLQPNEIGVHAAKGAHWQVAAIDADDAFAWRTGRLIYRDSSLATIVADLNRYFDKPIRIADPALARLRFSGTLKIDSQQEVLSLLESFLPLSVSSTDVEVVLHRRAG